MSKSKKSMRNIRLGSFQTDRHYEIKGEAVVCPHGDRVNLNGVYYVADAYTYSVSLIDVHGNEIYLTRTDGDTLHASVCRLVSVKPRTLNDEYEAIVLANGTVRVGCQTIPGKNAEKVAVDILRARGWDIHT